MEAALNSTTFGRTPLTAAPLKLGRAADNQLILNDPQVSSHHAEVTPIPGGNGYQVTDLNSRNGSFVNEQRLSPNTPRQLNPGDTVRFGGTSFTYEGQGSYAATQLASPPNYEATVLASRGDNTPNYAIPPQPTAYSAPPSYPQPGYPQQQPSYPMHQNIASGYTAPRKSKAGIWITLVLLLVVVGGGIGGYYVTRSTPEKTLQAYCDALLKGDADNIYAQLSKRGQAQTSPAKIKQGLAALAALGAEFKDCKYDSVQINGSDATASVTLTITSLKDNQTLPTKPSPAKLVNENGSWKIDEDTQQSTPSQ